MRTPRSFRDQTQAAEAFLPLPTSLLQHPLQRLGPNGPTTPERSKRRSQRARADPSQGRRTSRAAQGTRRARWFLHEAHVSPLLPATRPRAETLPESHTLPGKAELLFSPITPAIRESGLRKLRCPPLLEHFP